MVDRAKNLSLGVAGRQFSSDQEDGSTIASKPNKRQSKGEDGSPKVPSRAEMRHLASHDVPYRRPKHWAQYVSGVGTGMKIAGALTAIGGGVGLGLQVYNRFKDPTKLLEPYTLDILHRGGSLVYNQGQFSPYVRQAAGAVGQSNLLNDISEEAQASGESLGDVVADYRDQAQAEQRVLDRRKDIWLGMIIGGAAVSVVGDKLNNMFFTRALLDGPSDQEQQRAKRYTRAKAVAFVAEAGFLTSAGLAIKELSGWGEGKVDSLLFEQGDQAIRKFLKTSGKGVEAIETLADLEKALGVGTNYADNLFFVAEIQRTAEARGLPLGEAWKKMSQERAASAKHREQKMIALGVSVGVFGAVAIVGEAVAFGLKKAGERDIIERNVRGKDDAHQVAADSAAGNKRNRRHNNRADRQEHAQIRVAPTMIEGKVGGAVTLRF